MGRKPYGGTAFRRNVDRRVDRNAPKIAAVAEHDRFAMNCRVTKQFCAVIRLGIFFRFRDGLGRN